jgi:hypothetical protein
MSQADMADQDAWKSTRAMEGTLRIQLQELRKVLVKGAPHAGDVFVQLSCDTLTHYGRCYQSPALCLQAGKGSFETDAALQRTGSASAAAVPAKAREVGVDFTVRKMPPDGIVHLALLRATRLGYRTVAYASLHLDAITHELQGGREAKYEVPWQSSRGGGDNVGAVIMKAFWISTKQERLEMELMALQVCAKLATYSLCNVATCSQFYYMKVTNVH